MLLICCITRADWFQSVLQESVSCSTSQRATIYYNSTGCLDVALNVQTLLKHTTGSKIPILIPQHHKSIEIMLRIQPTYQAHLVWNFGNSSRGWRESGKRTQAVTGGLNVQLMVFIFFNSAGLSKTVVFPPAAAISASTAASHEKVSRAAGAWKVKINDKPHMVS